MLLGLMLLFLTIFLISITNLQERINLRTLLRMVGLKLLVVTFSLLEMQIMEPAMMQN
jgi:hypothetical protein